MATRREQHKAMPDCIVKAQALPDMKERADRIENAADCEKPQTRTREGGCQRVLGNDTAPTQEQAKNDGQAIEPPGKCELQSHADDGAQPDADAETY